MGDLVAFPVPLRVSSEPWLRQRQAATYVGVSVATLRRWHADGLAVHRVRGVALYRASELDRFVRLSSALG